MLEQNYKERLEELYSSLIPPLQIYREEKQRWDHFLSTDFNVVSEFIRPNENRLSNIIKCLLDANGSHGQGSKFLNGFLKYLPDHESELSGKQPQVKREDPTRYGENSKRRIDITIDFEGFGIGIENKPWAGEGDGQLAAYDEHLKCKYGQQCCLVFITPDGREPKSIDKPKCRIKKGELYCLSYRSDILEWIEECRQQCESDRFRWFLRDFRNYIRSEPTLRGEQLSKLSGESEIIIKHALENKEKENVAIVLDIIHTDMVKRIETLLKDHEDFADVNIGQWYSLAPGLRKSIIETVVKNSSDIMRKDNDSGSERIIIEHALENEKNLAMVLDIIFAGPELRQRIIKPFLKQLQCFIEKELDMSQWDFEWGDKFKDDPSIIFKDPYRNEDSIIFRVSKETWREKGGPQYSVGIRSRHEGKAVEIGAFFNVDNRNVDNRSLRDELDEKLEINREPNNLPDGWIKRLYSSDPNGWNYKNDPDSWNYANWRDTDTLVKMSTETDRVVNVVGEHLIDILKGAEPVIDEWVKENPLNG